MRAARTTMRGAIISTGVFGLGLFFYQKILSQQEEELNEKKRKFSDTSKDFVELTATTKIFEEQLKSADLKVRELCNGDEKCYSNYDSLKAKIEDEVKETFRKRV